MRTRTRTVRVKSRGQSKAAARGRSARTARTRKGSKTRGGDSNTPVRIKDLKKGKRRPSFFSRMLGEALRAAFFLLVFMAAGAGLGAAAKAGWEYLLRSPRLRIKEIVVRTGPHVSPEEVKTLAALHEGDNILGFSLSDCVKGIEIHPWVAKASVMRQFPDRVVIEVVERKPVLLVSLDTLYYLDREGEIFKKVLPGETVDYPVVTGLTLRDVVEDKEQTDELIKLALRIADLARQSEVLPLEEISEIHLDYGFGATLIRASDGMAVRLGKDELPGKWARLERTLLELGEDAFRVAELDMNFKDRATVHLRQAYQAAADRNL